MIFKRPLFFVAVLLVIFSCSQKDTQQSQQSERNQITFQENAPEQKVDVMVDGKLFTSYRWPDDVYKPVLYPIISSGGSMITRGFPLAPRAGERNDHRHQVGNWLNYGNVNGYDFWGNGHAGEKSPNGGVIVHKGIVEKNEGSGEASLVANAQWVDPSGKELLAETTEFHFLSRDSVRIIDRITTLKATEQVTFKDTKEGMFGLRVARQLELPSKDEVALITASGQVQEVKQVNNESVSGNYRSSEGVTGEGVWSTRARWMNLYGNIGDEKISVIICDHPKNLSYPTWWHARGYGLFSANPLGAKDFTKGETELNYSLAAGDSLTFRYRIIIASGQVLSDEAINDLANKFSQKY